MKVIILAGGYATRLRPLTDTIPKPLLPVGGRPIVDWIVENAREVPEVDEIHLVTNSRFADEFRRWAGPPASIVHDDGTLHERGPARCDRRSPAGRRARPDRRRPARRRRRQPVRVSPWRFRRRLASGAAPASAVAVYDCGDLELATQYGIVELDDDDRITYFIEKPADPPSTLAATATYLYRRAHLPLISRYLGEGHAPDQSGSFVAWLYQREPVYGYRFDGELVRHRQPRPAARGRQSPARAARAGGRAARTHPRSTLFTKSAQTRHTVAPVAWTGVARRPSLAPRAASPVALRPSASVPRLSLAAPAARRRRGVLAAARRRRGRSSAAASARAGGSRSPRRGLRSPTPVRPGRSSAPGRSTGSARPRASPPTSSSLTLERPAADVIAYIPPDGARQLRRGHHPAERLALELGRRWSLETAPLLDRVGARGAPDRARPARAPGERPRRLRGIEPRRGRRSCSSTTSTRPAPRPPRRRPPCGAAGAPGSSGHLREDGALTSRTGSTTTKEAAMRLQVKGKNVERRPVDPRVRRAQAGEARQAARRADAGRGRALGAAQPVDRRPATSRRGRSSRKARRCGRAKRRPTCEASIDQLVDKLERQVKRYRERRSVEPRRHTEHHGDAA